MAVSLIRVLIHGARLAKRASDAPPMPPQQVIGIIVVTALLLNVAFYFLSGMYFDDRSAIYGVVTAEHIADVRVQFGIFTAAVAAASVVSVMRPGWIAIGVPAVASVAALVAGVSAFAHDMTPVLPGALCVAGVVLALLIWKTIEQRRAAWAFLIGMTSVLSAVLLFGATKVRGVLETGLWTALIIPGLLAVATVALTQLRAEFRDAPAGATTDEAAREPA